MLLSHAHVPCNPNGPMFTFAPYGLTPALQPLADFTLMPPGDSETAHVSSIKLTEPVLKALNTLS